MVSGTEVSGDWLKVYVRYILYGILSAVERDISLLFCRKRVDALTNKEIWSLISVVYDMTDYCM